MALESQSAKKEKKEKKEKKNSKKGSSEAREGSKEIILNGVDLSARGKGREVLLRSIAGFLESNGFKKTLAVFQSEAQIEENSWKSPDVNLNEFVAKLSESSYFFAVPAIGSDKLEDPEKETEKKTRKKSTKDTSIEQTADEKTALEKSKLVDGEQQHEKKEKRKKNSSEELKPVEEEREEAHQKKKNKKEEKDKKKKKKKESEVEKETQEEEEKEKASVKENNVENEEKTASKKRKKGDEENVETVENDGKKRKLEANGSANTAPEEEQSAEPKSAKAFKRVKVEEVKFDDERLQDNSYWAKDGADSGYGAKAQQILEQVRGRDFRHEKTKKKRGTYRGGQIDLQSHSIKFNYSDEE